MRISPYVSFRKSGVQVRRGVVKIPPNDPCPCGSRVKYKRCCGAARGLLGWWRRRRVVRAWKRAHGEDRG